MKNKLSMTIIKKVILFAGLFSISLLLPAWALANTNEAAVNTTTTEHWLQHAAYVIVIIGGGFGGMIYSLSRNQGAVQPYRFKRSTEQGSSHYLTLNLGIYSDIFIGIGGGVIIFNLVPNISDGDLFSTLMKNSENIGGAISILMKILALSMIGGFAGKSLFDEAARKISREIDQVRDEAASVSNQLNQLQTVTNQQAELEMLLNALTDPTIPPLPPKQEDDFKQLVISAPMHIRHKVFSACQQAHNQNKFIVKVKRYSTEEINQINSYIGLQTQLLPAFDALIQAAHSDNAVLNEQPDPFKHRYLAHRGFIHKQLAQGQDLLQQKSTSANHWRKAEESLKQAIDARDRQENNRNMYWHYNLDWILCHLRLGHKEKVLKELQRGEVRDWISGLKNEGFVIANLRALPQDLLDLILETYPEFNDEFKSNKRTTKEDLTPRKPPSISDNKDVSNHSSSKSINQSLATLEQIRLGDNL